MICEIALVLAMDVSGSISHANYELQRDATASAVVQVLRPRPGLPIAVRAMMWETRTHDVVPWRVLRNAGDVAGFAKDLATLPRPGEGSTNLTAALQESLDSFSTVPCRAERRIIDISGDGESDQPGLEQQRLRAEALEVQVNGLPITTALQVDDIREYFRREVITRDGFVVPAAGWDEFARAMRNKLSLEIAGQLP